MLYNYIYEGLMFNMDFGGSLLISLNIILKSMLYEISSHNEIYYMET